MANRCKKHNKAYEWIQYYDVRHDGKYVRSCPIFALACRLCLDEEHKHETCRRYTISELAGIPEGTRRMTRTEWRIEQDLEKAEKGE